MLEKSSMTKVFKTRLLQVKHFTVTNGDEIGSKTMWRSRERNFLLQVKQNIVQYILN